MKVWNKKKERKREGKKKERKEGIIILINRTNQYKLSAIIRKKERHNMNIIPYILIKGLSNEHNPLLSEIKAKFQTS